MKKILSLAFLAASVLSCSDKGSEGTADYSMDLSVAQLQVEAEGGRVRRYRKSYMRLESRMRRRVDNRKPERGRGGRKHTVRSCGTQYRDRIAYRRNYRK